jgi:hypothetical protein
MKKLAIMAVCMVATFAAYAQGTFNFSNYAPGASPPINAPIFDALGAKLAGTAYLAQMYAGPSATELYAQSVPVPFRTGSGIGFIQTGADTTITLAGGAAGWRAGGSTVFVQVRAWAASLGTTYEAAVAKGQGQFGELAQALSVASGGGGTPPAPATFLVGLTSFSLAAVPEPSVIALGVLGAAVLALRRRK